MAESRSSDPASSSSPVSTGSYTVVARRYRPHGFGELVGQQHVAQALTNAIKTNRVGHAYLFTGARGVGKTSTARIFAKALNAPGGPTPDPDPDSDICRSIDSGEDVDVLEIDGASNRGIDEIRQLRSNVNVRPSRARFKIYIIDEVHMLTTPAFNALLKTLEEPPEHVKFIMCTTDPEKIPITVLSRCQRFDFAPVAADAITERLQFIVRQEEVVADDEALSLLARRAGGSMRDSQSLLEQLLAFCGQRITLDDVHALLGTARSTRLDSLAQRLMARDAAGALGELDGAIQEGVDVGQLIEQLLGYYRDLMTLTVGCDADLLLYSAPSESSRLREAGQQLGLETMLAIAQILDQALLRMRQSVHSRTLAELALVRICHLERLDDLAALVRAVEESQPTRPPQPRTDPQASSTRAPAGSAQQNSPPRKTSAEKKSPEVAEKSLEPSELAQDVLDYKATAETIWTRALEQIETLTADFARVHDSIAISAPNRMVVTFATTYNLEACERPDRKLAIERAVQKVAGRPLKVEFQLAPGAAKENRPVRKSPANVRQQTREVEQHPMVKNAIELFGAEVVRFDPPHRTGSQATG